MTPQQKIAERLYELLPHKKELGFGCEIKIVPPTEFEKYTDVLYKNGAYKYPKKAVIQNIDRGSSGETRRYDIGLDNMGYHTYEQISLNSDVWNKMFLYDKIEIIGQPIRLADILLAISMSLKNGDVLNCHVSSRNDLTIRTQDTLKDYNLEKDNILDQTDEFCIALSELL